MYIIVGASSGVGRALVEEFASNQCDSIIISQDIRDISAIARDQMNRNVGVTIIPLEINLSEKNIDFETLISCMNNYSKKLEGIIFPIGAVDKNDTRPPVTTEIIEPIYRINLTSVILLINLFLKICEYDPSRTRSIIGFGSIAAARGRGANLNYASAKAGLQKYFESLRHAFAYENIAIQFYTLGYMDTNLAFSINLDCLKGKPTALAKVVFKKRFKKEHNIFYPRFWVVVIFLLKLLPWKIYKRLNY